MVGMEQALQDWLNQVSYLSNLSIDEQTKITSAGAKVYRDLLSEETLNKHHTTTQHENRKHLSDDIVVKATNVDGQKNGVSTVGWEDGMNATIARWLTTERKKSKVTTL